MTLVATDGFDMYNGLGVNTGLQAMWTLRPGGIGTYSGGALTSGRFAGQCFRLNTSAGATNNVGGYSRPLTSTRTSGSNGFAFKVSSGTLSGGQPLFGLLLSGTYVVSFNLTTAGEIKAYTGTLSTLLGSSAPGVFTAGSWYYLEIEWVINSSTGSLNVYLDGVSVLSLSGINTAATGANANQWYFGQNSNVSGTFDVDDYYEADTNTRIGPMRIDTLRPSSDNSVQFSHNTGTTNFACVNETLVDGDTTYVQDGVSGHSDLYGNGALPVTPVSVYGVQAVTFADKTDANPRSIYQQIKSGTTLSIGPAKSLSGNYTRYERMVLTNPDTSSAWDYTTVNSVLQGPQVV